MANDETILPDVSNLQAQAKDATTSLNQFSGTLQNISTSAQTATQQLNATADASVQTASRLSTAEGAASKFGEVSTNTFEEFKKVVGITDLSLDGLQETLAKTGDAAIDTGAKLLLSFGAFFSKLPDDIAKVESFSSTISKMGVSSTESFKMVGHQFSQMSELISKIPVIGNILEPLLKFGGKGLEEWFKGFDRGTQIKRNILELAANTGQLSRMFDGTTDKLVDMDTELATYSKTMLGVSQATGVGVNEVMRMAQVFGRSYPDALSKTIETMNAAGNSMNALEASMKVATAYGVEHSKVAGDLHKMYMTFNVTATEAFQRISDMYSISKDLKMPASELSDVVLKNAESFKMFGDNTEAATNLLRVFARTFKDSSLSPAGITQLVSNMTEGVHKLTVGQKAFISAQTGGPGGLAGSLQMDLLLRQGKSDEVLRKTMQAMQNQFGGPVLTLQQATANPALSGEFYKQVKFLTDVAGIVHSDEEAYRVLEAMQSGVLDQIKLGEDHKTGQEALREATERGNNILRESQTILTGIRQAAEATALLTTGMQTEQVRNLLGAGSPFIDIINRTQKGSVDAVRGGAVGVQSQVAIENMPIDVTTSKAFRVEMMQKILPAVLDAKEALANGYKYVASESLKSIKSFMESRRDSAKTEGRAADVAGYERSIRGIEESLRRVNKIDDTLPKVKAPEPTIAKPATVTQLTTTVPTVRPDIVTQPTTTTSTISMYIGAMQKQVSDQISNLTPMRPVAPRMRAEAELAANNTRKVADETSTRNERKIGVEFKPAKVDVNISMEGMKDVLSKIIEMHPEIVTEVLREYENRVATNGSYTT